MISQTNLLILSAALTLIGIVGMLIEVYRGMVDFSIETDWDELGKS